MTCCVLLIQSLVVLSLTEVKVVPLKETIRFETLKACKEAEKEVRAKGPNWQARCLPETSVSTDVKSGGRVIVKKDQAGNVWWKRNMEDPWQVIAK